MKHEIVSKEEWLQARRELLKKEKAFTKERDRMTQSIRNLPWVEVDKNYEFESTNGVQTLPDLFNEKSQLIIYHFMLGPEWEEGCMGCSFMADNFDKQVINHIEQRDTSFVVVARAPIENIEAFKKRMDWSFKWVSSVNNDFNYDYQATIDDEKGGMYNYADVPADKGGGEMPGVSVFYKDDDGKIYHTYSRYGRGLDIFLTTYHYLDIVPKGRDEGDLAFGMEWVKLHDLY